MDGTRTVLVVMSPERSPDLIRSLSAVVPLVVTVPTCDEASSVLRREPVGLVLTDLSLPDGSWCDVVNRAGDLRPGTPVVVCARLADERLWTDVLDAGGFDVLAEPYQEPELRRVLDAAAAGASTRKLSSVV